MSNRISYKTMTDAELIDEGLDCDPDSLAYELAVTLDALPINHGSVQIDDPSETCTDHEDLQNEVYQLECEVSRLEDALASINTDRLVYGAKRARAAIKEAHDKVNYLFGLGGDDHE